MPHQTTPEVAYSATFFLRILPDCGVFATRVYTPPPMQPKLKRVELDQVAGHYGLDSRGVDVLLEIADARPDRRETLHFLYRMFLLGGLLSLAAGIVFFVAANWSAIAVFGRFALLEALLLACVVLALLRMPPANLGRGALFLAFVVTGTLLALFGQTYQTGADVYELFLTWALLGLPFVMLANWSVASAAWTLVFNTALMLFLGWRPSGGLLWALFGSSHMTVGHLVLAAAWLNALLWIAFEIKRIAAVPEWVRRIVISCAFAFTIWAGVMVVEHYDGWLIELLGSLVAMIAVSVYAWSRRKDIYPLAAAMGSFIIVSMVWLVDALDIEEGGTLFVLALWLIGTSTVAGRVLTVTSRRWRADGLA